MTSFDVHLSFVTKANAPLYNCLSSSIDDGGVLLQKKSLRLKSKKKCNQ